MKCDSCDNEISKRERDYSIKYFGKELCRDCQEDYENLKNKHEERKERSTPEALKLYETLIKMSVPAKLEKWDKHKHIDIAIPSARVNIEVDGMQHSFDPKQALADLKRTFYSFKRGYVTLRIPNKLITENLYDTAKYIKKLLEESEEQSEEE